MLASGVAVFLIAGMLLRAALTRSQNARRWDALITTLETLSDAQEDALARDGQYAAHLAAVGGVDTARLVPPPGILLEFERLGPMDWRAVARDTALRVGPRNCGIFRGDAASSPHRAVVNPGIPACW